MSSVPEALDIDTSVCRPYNELLAKNQAFYASVMAAVASKNKLDGAGNLMNRARGTTNSNAIAVRDHEIRCILKAIACKKTDFLNRPAQYSLATHGLADQTSLASRAGVRQLTFTGGPEAYKGGKKTKRRRFSKRRASMRRRR